MVLPFNIVVFKFKKKFYFPNIFNTSLPPELFVHNPIQGNLVLTYHTMGTFPEIHGLLYFILFFAYLDLNSALLTL